ncbi:hypothetical protein NQ318_004246 [Aromia moschata]|uniref:C2H2-type domain-containing protein n=1 Tax=Aromia moschata TaxID=1265417 RepID=A0AAV8X6X1_9CUCU|nr:hypothetical protein NQ318_004246 [Aromia moschata]
MEENGSGSVMPFEDTEMKSFVDKSYNPETNNMFIKSEVYQSASEIEMEYTNDHTKLIEDAAETRVAKQKEDLSKCIPIHQRSLERKSYDCSFCSYKTHRKSNLNSHMLIHKDASEVTTYDCNFCSYKTKRKGPLKIHMLIHKDASEDVKTEQNQ